MENCKWIPVNDKPRNVIGSPRYAQNRGWWPGSRMPRMTRIMGSGPQPAPNSFAVRAERQTKVKVKASASVVEKKTTQPPPQEASTDDVETTPVSFLVNVETPDSWDDAPDDAPDDAQLWEDW